MNIHAEENYGTYLNKMLFNVFSGNPDPSIYKFLNDFAPILLHLPENNTEWTVCPPGDFIPPAIITHSYIFHKHPFIDAAIKQGEFKVYTNVFNDTVYHGTGIKNVQVILEFEKLDDASELFEKFRKDLKTLGQEADYYEDSSQRFSVVYSRESVINIPSKVRIHLLAGATSNNSYQLSISIN